MNAAILTTHPSRISCSRRSKSLNRVCMTSNSSYRISLPPVRQPRPAPASTPLKEQPRCQRRKSCQAVAGSERDPGKGKFGGSLWEVLSEQGGLDLVPTHPFCRVQGAVGLADQLLIVHAIRRARRNPHAYRQPAERLDAAATERVFFDQRPKALHRLHRLVFGCVDHDQAELFPAVPR